MDSLEEGNSTLPHATSENALGGWSGVGTEGDVSMLGYEVVNRPSQQNQFPIRHSLYRMFTNLPPPLTHTSGYFKDLVEPVFFYFKLFYVVIII